MRKFLLLALPLAALLFVTGCDETQTSSASSGVTTLTPADTTAAAPAPAQPQQSNRRSTTQPLPVGANYIHTQDLADGPLATPRNEG